MFDQSLLNLVILPGKPHAQFGGCDLYDKAYDHFKHAWERTLRLRAGEGSFDAYCFFRQDVSMNLMYGDVVAAQALSSLLHVGCHITQDLSYFENFKGAPEDFLVSQNIKAISTIEYSSSSRTFSPRKIDGLCLNEVINAIGSKFGFNRGAGAVVGLPRRVTGTNDKASRLGFRTLAQGKGRYGLTVDVMIGLEHEIQPHEDPKVQSLIDRIWLERTDLAHYQTPFSNRNKTELQTREEVLSEKNLEN